MGTCYSHLSPDERIRIERLHCEQGLSVRETARLVGRDKATVSRELRRGLWFASNENESYRPYRLKRLKTGPWTSEPFYSALAAQRRADLRRHESRKPRRMDSDRLRSWVMDALRRGWSPELFLFNCLLRFGGGDVLLDSGVVVLRLCHESELASSFDDAGAEREFDTLVPVPGHVPVQPFDELVSAHAGEVPPMEELLLEPAEETLRGRVVRAAAFRAHRPGELVLFADADPFGPPVVAAAVRVDDGTLPVPERGARVHQHPVGQLRVRTGADRPGHRHPVERGRSQATGRPCPRGWRTPSGP